MIRILHLPVRKKAQQARETLAQLDWPNGLAVAPENLQCHLEWLPFKPSTGKSLLDGRKEPKLSRLVLSSELTSAKNMRKGPPPHLRDKSINHDVLFAPFFLFSELDSDENWAVVDAVQGDVASGNLKAKSSSAMGRLALLVLLALFAFFLGTAYVHLLLAMAFGALAPLLRLTTGLTQIIVAGLLLVLFFWLFRWMSGHRKGLFTMLQEPIARVESGYITLPLDRSWFALLRAAGNVTLLLVPLIALSLMMPVPGSGIEPKMLRLLQLILALAFGIFALRLSRGNGLPLAAFANSSEEMNLPKSAATDLVKVILDVALLAMYGMVVGHVLDLFDFGGTLNEVIRVDLGSLAGLGVRAGAFAGVIVSGVSLRNRLTIAVAMLAEFVGELLITPWLGIPILLGIVAVTSWTTKRSSPSGSHPEGSYWEALRAGWAYCFGAAIGGIAGRIVGLVFMGAAGVVVGEVLGDRVIAGAALMTQQASDDP